MNLLRHYASALTTLPLQPNPKTVPKANPNWKGQGLCRAERRNSWLKPFLMANFKKSAHQKFALRSPIFNIAPLNASQSKLLRNESFGTNPDANDLRLALICNIVTRTLMRQNRHRICFGQEIFFDRSERSKTRHQARVGIRSVFI